MKKGNEVYLSGNSDFYLGVWRGATGLSVTSPAARKPSTLRAFHFYPSRECSTSYLACVVNLNFHSKPQKVRVTIASLRLCVKIYSAVHLIQG